MDTDIIAHCLELVSDRAGDPSSLVFQRLFAENPEIEPLFVRDTAGLVRGEMMAVTLEHCWIAPGAMLTRSAWSKSSASTTSAWGWSPRCSTPSSGS